MDVWETFFRWLGLKPAQRPENQLLREPIEAGRRAKFAENYDLALSSFERAMKVAQARRQSASVVVIGLHMAEVYIRLKRWDDAEGLLASLLHTAQTSGHNPETSYIYSVYGTMTQEQGDWVGARAYYEKALAAARSVRSTGAEGRALAHLGDTYLHEKNSSFATHLLRESLPRLQTAGDLELSGYFVGLLGMALTDSGHAVEGTHLIGRALQLATHMNYQLYIRMWSLELGGRALVEGRYSAALEHLSTILAMDAVDSTQGRADRARALGMLSRLHHAQRDYEKVQQAAEQALELRDALPPGEQAQTLGALGLALRSLGQMESGSAYLQEAAAMLETEGAGREALQAMRQWATTQAETDPEAAESLYQRVLNRAQADNDDEETARVQRDMGLLYHRQGKGTEALQVWQQALAFYEDKRHYAPVARLYVDMATARRGLGQTTRALKDLEQALTVLNSVDKNDLETRGLVLSNAATVYAEQGDVENADSFFTDAIQLAERLGDKTAEATRRSNYAWFLTTLGRPRRSISLLQQALDISQSLGLTLQTAVQTDNLGLAYDSMSDYPAAVEQHRRALAVVEPLNQPYWEAMFQINLAHTLLAMNEATEAETLLDSALAYGQSAAQPEVTARAQAGHAKRLLLAGQPGEADAPLREAVELARKNELRRLLADFLSLQSEQRAAVDQPDTAAELWSEAQRLYARLGMPQAKIQPNWLADPAQPS